MTINTGFLWCWLGSSLGDILTRAKLVCLIYIELLGLRVSAQFPHQLSTLGGQLSFMCCPCSPPCSGERGAWTGSPQSPCTPPLSHPSYLPIKEARVGLWEMVMCAF